MDSPELNDKKHEQVSRRMVFILALAVIFLSIFGGYQLKMNYEAKTQSVTAQSNLYTALMAFETAAAQYTASQEQLKVALSRQIAANAQLLLRTDNTQRMTALLLSIESMRLSPSGEAAQIMWSAMEDPVLQINHQGIAAFSPNGDVIVSAGNDKTIRVWRAFTGEEITRISYMSERYTSDLTLSPDGRYIALNKFDETKKVWVTHIWEVYSGREISRKVHSTFLDSLAFSPDSNFIVSAECQRNKNLKCYKEIVRIWDAVTGENITHIVYDVAYRDRRPLVSFRPDGVSIISSGCDKQNEKGGCFQSSIYLWDVSTGREITKISQIDGEISAKFSGNGKYILSSSSTGELRVWSVESGKEVFNKKDSGITTGDAVFSPNGRYLAGGWNSIRVWEIETGKEILEIPFLSGNRFITFSPDGKYLAFLGDWSTPTPVVQIWEIETRKEVFRQLLDSYANSAAFSPDGRHLIVGGDKIRIWEILPGRHGIPDFTLPPDTHSPDGSNAVVLDGSELIVSDIFTGNEIGKIRLMDKNFEMRQITFSADGRFMAQGNKDGEVSVWDVSTGNETFYHAFPNDWVDPVSFTADGRYLALGVDRTIYVWDVLNNREISHMVHNAPGLFASFSPNDKYLISGGFDLTAHIWDTFNGIEIAHFYLDGSVRSTAFSPDGKYAAFAGGSSVVIWDVIGRKEIKRFVSNAATVFFSADGDYMLIGADANPAVTLGGEYWGRNPYISSVWAVNTWQEISRIPHEVNMFPLAFDPDNELLIFSRDGQILGWKWQPDDLVENACLSVTRNLTYNEWYQYIGTNLPYQPICSNLPLEGQATPISITTPTVVP